MEKREREGERERGREGERERGGERETDLALSCLLTQSTRLSKQQP